MLNAMTVDVEDWYQTNGLNIPVEEWHKYEDRVVEHTRLILELFSFYQVKGTFFILGCIARKHPELVEEIAKAGHEIGSHGGWHQLMYQMSWEEIRQDLLDSKIILEQISGNDVHLFRAPSWSISSDRYQVLTVLQTLGYKYDSSLQPFRTPLSGVRGIPFQPFQPILDGETLDILEFPPTVLKLLGLSIPFSGGFYLRAIPENLIVWALKRVNRKRQGMIYVHPWEFDEGQPRLAVKPWIQLIQYYNLGKTRKKMERLLQTFAFAPVGEILKSTQHLIPKTSLFSKDFFRTEQ